MAKAGSTNCLQNAREYPTLLLDNEPYLMLRLRHPQKEPYLCSPTERPIVTR
ncbi:hypothetical protein NKDENANG_00945 [Candidatus Entotheonellaceae bacterium PAL068K]